MNATIRIGFDFGAIFRSTLMFICCLVFCFVFSNNTLSAFRATWNSRPFSVLFCILVQSSLHCSVHTGVILLFIGTKRMALKVSNGIGRHVLSCPDGPPLTQSD